MNMEMMEIWWDVSEVWWCQQIECGCMLEDACGTSWRLVVHHGMSPGDCTHAPTKTCPKTTGYHRIPPGSWICTSCQQPKNRRRQQHDQREHWQPRAHLASWVVQDFRQCPGWLHETWPVHVSSHLIACARAETCCQRYCLGRDVLPKKQRRKPQKTCLANLSSLEALSSSSHVISVWVC